MLWRDTADSELESRLGQPVRRSAHAVVVARSGDKKMNGHNVVDMSLGRIIASWADRAPDRKALSFEGRSWTYGQLAARIDRLATALAAGGVGRDDRVGFLGLNHPAFFEAMFAAARLGAIFVPLNFRLTSSELDYIINDADVHTLFADDDHRAVLEQIRTKSDVQRYIGTESAARGWESHAALIQASQPIAKPAKAEADDVALLMYTSGTTGRPKGAMLSHGNLCWNNINLLHLLELGSTEVSLVVAPLFHIGGLNVTTLLTWQKGGEIVLHRNFDPAAAVAAIEEHGVTQMFGVPAMYLFMSQEASFAAADLSSLRVAVVGGAPVPEPLIERYLDKGVPFAQGYGLTETAPAAAFLLPEYARTKIGSAGFPPPHTEVAILDAAGDLLARGQRGEICVRGPNVMKGYWRQPEATAGVMDQRGWFHSGDSGFYDDDGFLYVVDRVNDMVVSGGENVYPAEVESALYEHPRIKEVAVIGLPDERWGEAVTAIVVLDTGHTLTLDELRDFAAGKLARYKLPTRLYDMQALPRNAAGKVLKFELRERYLES